MRRAPTLLLTAALLVAASVARLVAQTPATPVAARPARAAVGGFVMDGIALTPGQTVLVRAINRRYADERAAITRGDPKRASQPAVRAELFRSIDRMMAEEREVLTAAQRPRFDRNVDSIHASWARLRTR